MPTNQDILNIQVAGIVATVFATICGPIFAIQIQKFLERNRQSKDRRENVFKTLMTTRFCRLSLNHINALNMIELEFPKKKQFIPVLDAWKEYFDNLSHKPQKAEALQAWIEKNDDLFNVLLLEMGKTTQYKFDKVTIMRSAYSPEYFAIKENEQEETQKLLRQILSNEKPILIQIIEKNNEK